LANKLDVLQQEEKIIQSTAWSDEVYLQRAKKIFEQDSQLLLDELENLRKQVATNADLAELNQQLIDIENSIREKIKAK
ncbi:MAG: hypothetical protein HQK53_14255, partial [Oligoflexia bacterium]|nr:hypothetical protein [Oligoflexia bacterium]